MQWSRFFRILKSYWSVQLVMKNRICSPSMESYPKDITVVKKLLENREKVKKSSKIVYSANHYQTISEYLDSKDCLREVKNKIPLDYLLRRFKCPTSMFIIDHDVACDVFRVLKPHLESYSGHILEVNAGPGVLTTQLLMAKLPRLRIYELDVSFYKELKILQVKHTSDARLFKANLLALHQMIQRDQEDNGGRIAEAFDGLPFRSWEDDPVMKMITAVSADLFILHVMYSVIFQSSMCVYGRPEFFITMPTTIYFKLTQSPEQGLFGYTSKVVLFHLLFEHSVLTKVPEKAVIPWMRKRRKPTRRKRELRGEDDEELFLVKITPRQDLFQRVPPHLLKPLWFFVRVMLQKRKTGLIAAVEKWIPGSGVRLIALGYTIFTQCGYITPDEYLKLFLEFSSWPEFKSCSFLPAMEGVMADMEKPGLHEELLIKTQKGRATDKNITTAEDSSDLNDDSLEENEQTDNENLNEGEKER